MLLTKYNHRDFEPVALGNLVDRFFNSNAQSGERVLNFSPKVDIIESKEAFEIQLSVPGIEKEEIAISIENGKLIVGGERKKEKNEEGRSYQSIESSFGSFKRTFHLPENIDEDKINGSYNNGILSIEIPKVEPKSTIKQIAIS